MMIPSRKGYFVKATDGENLRVTLCQTQTRAQELFLQDIKRFDPFQSGRDIEESDDCVTIGMGF